MRKSILMIWLAVVSSVAAAQWVKIGDEGIVTLYADPATIGGAGNMVQMWDMLDYKAVQSRPYGAPYLSQKTQHEFDCKEQRARTIQLFLYADNLAGGEEVNAGSDPAEWKPVSAGSTTEKLLKFACEKR